MIDSDVIGWELHKMSSNGVQLFWQTILNDGH